MGQSFGSFEIDVSAPSIQVESKRGFKSLTDTGNKRSVKLNDSNLKEKAKIF